MKLNTLFVAVALAYGSSLVLTRSIDSEYYSRDLADLEKFNAREVYDVHDARDFNNDEELDLFERELPAPVTHEPHSTTINVDGMEHLEKRRDKRQRKKDRTENGDHKRNNHNKPNKHNKPKFNKHDKGDKSNKKSNKSNKHNKHNKSNKHVKSNKHEKSNKHKSKKH